VRTEELKFRQIMTKRKVHSSFNVTLKDVRVAVFQNEADRIIFKSALSDIAGHDVSVRADGVRTMAGIRHDLSVKAIIAQMAREPSPKVRQECIKALTTLEKKEGLSTIVHALKDQAALVRLAAIWGLYRLAGAECAPALIKLFSDEDEEIRRRAATCIGWLGKDTFAVKLLPLLADRSISVRRAVVEAMGNLRSRQVVSNLIECMNDPEESIRKAVLAALERITGKKMSQRFSINEKSRQLLIERWRAWWKEVRSGQGYVHIE